MQNIQKVDEKNKYYKEFIEAYMNGASKQDIYDDLGQNYSCGKRTPYSNIKDINRQHNDAKDEFLRVFEHMHDIVNYVERVIDIKGKKILDFGCGTGALSIALAMKGGNVIGVDPTQASLHACEARRKYFELDTSSFTPRLVSSNPGLPFEEKSGSLLSSVVSNLLFKKKIV